MKKDNFKFQNITPNRELPFRLLIHNSGVEHVVPRHWHTSFEISYVVSGQNDYFYLDGNEFTQSEGEIVVVNPYQVHALSLPNSKKRIAMTLMLPKDFLQMVGIDFRDVRIQNRISEKNSNTKQLNGLFKKLYECTLSKNEDNKIIKQIGFTCLIFSKLMDFWSEKIDLGRNIAIYKGLNYLEPVLAWMEKNYMNSISISDMAKKAKLSPSYFAHIFKKYIQQSPMDYLVRIRLQHARQLLVNTDNTISQVAEKTGFISYISFVNAFKKLYRITPKKFQKKYKSSI